MTKVKKVSFRVRRIYYDQFANGMKREELRALTPYWFKMLSPTIPHAFLDHPLICMCLETINGSLYIPKATQPEIAIIHSPGQPTLCFKIRYIYVDRPEKVLGRPLSEQGKRDIPTELCIVTKMAERICYLFG